MEKLHILSKIMRDYLGMPKYFKIIDQNISRDRNLPFEKRFSYSGSLIFNYF